MTFWASMPFFKMQSSLCEAYLPLTLTWVKLNVRPEVTTGPTHFLTPMNYGKAFSSLYYMECSYQCSDQFQFLPGHRQAKAIYLKIILITPEIIWSRKLKKKERWNCGITNTNIKHNYKESRYLFFCNYEQSSQNNQCTWCSP